MNCYIFNYLQFLLAETEMDQINVFLHVQTCIYLEDVFLSAFCKLLLSVRGLLVVVSLCLCLVECDNYFLFVMSNEGQSQRKRDDFWSKLFTCRGKRELL